ncbi:class II D-tagatose-bisphosphate aldolase, non-catalytic subunit [Chelativorans sp. AA-79]|uniref:class II D-tagatose-bisphosphate aldolase non-catalytic subunit n=1 Tax=Chelativorans sp. AA-79 TaxID=3028735 RepID=UPI0023F6DF0A|nr:class II D-tagatose-bisphosphate aldolase, non-catalytic subunit [Chelativorans sp. AA-79]WEX10610.1 class II D-tagatose-bisphosphate aldolase, non-catalytic subunit [Chelativorans sp. AA-79]
MSILADVVAANRAGERVALPAWCTAHPETLSAVFACYREGDLPILVEATCNQVNQVGGYTGMTPADFRGFVEDLACREGIDPGRVLLGGDHLGPNPWKNEPAETAMEKARAMVEAYVRAGFTKIHLDASMACADDTDLDEETMAARAAELCVVAETAVEGEPLSYVIGTEVPIPGGETEALDGLAVTAPEAAGHTVELHRRAFSARGLAGAFERVVGLVVQPGVDFGNGQVFAFEPAEAEALAASASTLPGIAFEAHSTDYQSEEALSALTAAHFAILKVGPELTFAYRQAVFALAGIERELDVSEPSRLIEAVRAEMEAEPTHWRSYVARGPRETRMMLYGLSDRVRYYWPRPAIRKALARLRANLAAHPPEPGLVAQAIGRPVGTLAPGTDLMEATMRLMVGDVVAKYRRASGL